MRMRSLALSTLVTAALFCSAQVAMAQATATRSQVATGESLTVTAEVLAIDAVKRTATFKGPLGGSFDSKIADEVKNLDKVKVGDLVSLTYYSAIAASVNRQGDTKPLFSAANVAAASGAQVRETSVISKSFTVFSVDPVANTLVLEAPDKMLSTIDVVRPEFRAKLADLKAGDKIDVSYSEAWVTGLAPVAAGTTPKMTMKTGTLVVDNGTVLKKVGNTLMIRNDRGRVFSVTVDGDAKFKLDGRDATIADIREGTKLTRTALRVKEVSYSE